MLSRETRSKIKGICSDRIGDEIVNRMSLLQKTPISIQTVQRILNSLDTSEKMNSDIKQTFHSKMSNYDHGSCGFDISDGLSQCVTILQMALDKKDLSKIKNILRQAISKVEFEALALALSSADAARNFEKVYDRMLESLVQMEELRDIPEKMLDEVIPIAILLDAKQDRIHTEKTIKKRIYFRKVE